MIMTEVWLYSLPQLYIQVASTTFFVLFLVVQLFFLYIVKQVTSNKVSKLHGSITAGYPTIFWTTV